MTFKELLKQADCSQARLSRALGVSGECVRLWVGGITIPRLDVGVKIAEVLGVPLEKVAACFVA